MARCQVLFLSKLLKMDVFLLFKRVYTDWKLAKIFTKLNEFYEVGYVFLCKRKFLRHDLFYAIKCSVLLRDTIFLCRLVLVCLHHSGVLIFENDFSRACPF